MSRLFKHSAKLTVARQKTGFIAENPAFFETVGNAVEITDLKFTFGVKRSLEKSPNTLELTIYNLNAHSRAEIEKKPATIILAAGYDDVNRLVFSGDLTQAWSEKKSTEWETYVRAKDGGRAYAEAQTRLSYKPPIQVERVLSDVARSMNLELPPEVERSTELKRALSTGISMRGPTRDVLTRLLAPYGYGWSIQNGSLQILRDGDTRGEAFLINADTGLKNSPTRETSDKALQRLEISFEVALYPELYPGCLLKVESVAFDGVFKALDIEHAGDSMGETWTTSVKARSV